METQSTKTLTILKENENKLNEIEGPRVGDFLILEDGSYTRFTHEYDEGLQVGGIGGSYHLGFGYCSYSGGLDALRLKEDMTLTQEKRLGSVWIWKDGYVGAHNGAYFKIPFRVYDIRPNAVKFINNIKEAL